MITNMPFRKLFALLLIAPLCFGQQSSTPAKPAAKSNTTVTITLATDPEIDTDSIVKETEQVDTRNHKMGIFWWVPPDFWEAAVRKQGYTSEQATRYFQPFRKYNLFLVAVGDMELGNISWTKEPELKKNLRLRDQRDNVYRPMEELPDDIRPMVDVMKPVFRNLMGNFGDGIQFFLFPAKDASGNSFADPRKTAEIFLDVSDVMGTSTSTYSWKFPLTSLTPPKYCPVGKEKVEANWKYCPWHGNKLEEAVGPSKTVAPVKP
jgi:hypothetical protein